MEIEISTKFVCPNCNTAINHNYTQDDVLKFKHLDLTCQQCGHKYQMNTATLIKQAKEKVIKELQKAFK